MKQKKREKEAEKQLLQLTGSSEKKAEVKAPENDKRVSKDLLNVVKPYSSTSSSFSCDQYATDTSSVTSFIVKSELLEHNNNM